MRAMVLAAGLGSRLGDLGKKTPKCLLEVAGKTILERVIDALKSAGVEAICLNTHHLAAQVENFITLKKGFGLEVKISHESELLGTGGALKRAQDFFTGQEPFFLHNADVYSELDLTRLREAHRADSALATLAVMQRDTQRALLFDRTGALVGWENAGADARIIPGCAPARRYGFSGVQIISPEVFEFMRYQPEVFSIIETYMSAAKAQRRISAFDMLDVYWADIGTAARLEELRARFYK